MLGLYFWCIWSIFFQKQIDFAYTIQHTKARWEEGTISETFSRLLLLSHISCFFFFFSSMCVQSIHPRVRENCLECSLSFFQNLLLSFFSEFQNLDKNQRHPRASLIWYGLSPIPFSKSWIFHQELFFSLHPLWRDCPLIGISFVCQRHLAVTTVFRWCERSIQGLLQVGCEFIKVKWLKVSSVLSAQDSNGKCRRTA